MRKPKTHGFGEWPTTPGVGSARGVWFAGCGLDMLGKPSRRPTCRNCQRVLKARRKGK